MVVTEKYVDWVLVRFNMGDAKQVSTPLAGHMTKHMYKFTKKRTEVMTCVPYSFDVGSIMYVMVYTWPYIAHIIGVVSKSSSKSGREH